MLIFTVRWGCASVKVSISMKRTGEAMLTIGVIGLGTIAQKAYLPVYAQMQNQVHWLLNTRNEDKLEQLSAQYGLESAGHSLQDLDGQPLDAVMIHTPTATHYQYVKHFWKKVFMFLWISL